MKIVTVLGARPQFIKASSVNREITNQVRNGIDIQEIIVHTGQHYDANMSDIFFEEMDIPKPDYFLEISEKTHGSMTGRMLEKIEKILIQEKPDWVLVYGDTNSTLAGALAASKLHIKIAHVEAGLRSFNMKMPEEQNRILTDRLSTILFCPTQRAVQNLKTEGYDHIKAKILNIGDVMYDSAMFYSERSDREKYLSSSEEKYILVTCHRAENTDIKERMERFVNALNKLSEKEKIIFPIHPRTKKILIDYGLNLKFKTINPVGYLEMISLLKKCRLVMTDSGGLQKEAYFFNKPCITLREETEWVELVDAGVNQLVGSEVDKIIAACVRSDPWGLEFPKGLYGDGKSSDKIVRELLGYSE